MAEFSFTKTFDVPADRVWAFASDPQNLSRWLPTAQRSAAQGGDRVELAGESHGHRYDKTAALEVDSGAHLLSWSAPEDPGYEGWLEISGDDGRSRLMVHLSVPDDRPAAGRTEEVERGMVQALDGLADAGRA